MSTKNPFGVLVRIVGVLVFLEGLKALWLALAQSAFPSLSGSDLCNGDSEPNLWAGHRHTRLDNDSMASMARASRLAGETANCRAHGIADFKLRHYRPFWVFDNSASKEYRARLHRELTREVATEGQQ
jgi:hypothetical protein